MIECYRLVFVGLPVEPMKMNLSSIPQTLPPCFRASRANHFPSGPIGLIHIFVTCVVPAGRRSALDQHCGSGLTPSQHSLWTLSKLLWNWQMRQGKSTSSTVVQATLFPLLCTHVRLSKGICDIRCILCFRCSGIDPQRGELVWLTERQKPGSPGWHS